MIFAQIKNSLVVNTITIDDASILDLFKNDANGEPYDYVLQINFTYPQPGIGWTFDGITFIPPEEIPPSEEL